MKVFEYAKAVDDALKLLKNFKKLGQYECEALSLKSNLSEVEEERDGAIEPLHGRLGEARAVKARARALISKQ